MGSWFLPVLTLFACELSDPENLTPDETVACSGAVLDFGEVEVGSEKELNAVHTCEGGPDAEVILEEVVSNLPEVFLVPDVPKQRLYDGVQLEYPVVFGPLEEGPFETTIDHEAYVFGWSITVRGVGVVSEPPKTAMAYSYILVEDQTVPGTGGANGTEGADIDAVTTERPDGFVRTPIVTGVTTGPGDCSTTFGHTPDLSDVEDAACSTTAQGGEPSFVSLGGQGGSVVVGMGVPFDSGDTLHVVECGLDGNEVYSVLVEDTDGNRYLLLENVSGPVQLEVPYLEDLPAPM